MRITTYRLDTWFLEDSCHVMETLKEHGLKFGPFTTMARAEVARQELLAALKEGCNWEPDAPSVMAHIQTGFVALGHAILKYEIRAITTQQADHLDHEWQIRFYRLEHVTKSVVVEGETYTRFENQEVTVFDWSPLLSENRGSWSHMVSREPVFTQTSVDIRKTVLEIEGDEGELEVL